MAEMINNSNDIAVNISIYQILATNYDTAHIMRLIKNGLEAQWTYNIEAKRFRIQNKHKYISRKGWVTI